MTNLEVKIDTKKKKTNMCKAWEDLKFELLAKGEKKEQAKNIKENLRKAKALVKAGIAKEIVAKIMGVNIALL